MVYVNPNFSNIIFYKLLLVLLFNYIIDSKDINQGNFKDIFKYHT